MANSASELLLPRPQARAAAGIGTFARTESPQASIVEPAPRYLAIKPVADAVLATVLLIATAPVVLLAALIIRLTSRGPAFYTQERVGHDGRLFVIYKLRTMVKDCEAATGAVWSRAGDPRVTPVGRILRATHIDEFPQLLNVLLGHMSLIGPRPERPEIVDYLRSRIDGYVERLRVRPGITGLAQVQLPPDTSLEEVRRKLVCDRYYIDQLSADLDFRVALCTGMFLLGIPLPWSRRWLRIPEPLAVECGVRL